MRADETLSSRRDSQLITSAVQDAIIMIDQREVITFWSGSATRVFGYAKDEAIGKHVHELLSPSDYRPDVRGQSPTFQFTGKEHIIGKTVEMEALKRRRAVRD